MKKQWAMADMANGKIVPVCGNEVETPAQRAAWFAADGGTAVIAVTPCRYSDGHGAGRDIWTARQRGVPFAAM